VRAGLPKKQVESLLSWTGCNFSHTGHIHQDWKGQARFFDFFPPARFCSSCSLSCLLLSIPRSPSTSYFHTELQRAFASSPTAHLSSQHISFSLNSPCSPLPHSAISFYFSSFGTIFTFTRHLVSPGSCLGTSSLRRTWQQSSSPASVEWLRTQHSIECVFPRCACVLQREHIFLHQQRLQVCSCTSVQWAFAYCG